MPAPMSESIQRMPVNDTLVEAVYRAIAFEFRRNMEMYNVQIDSRTEYTFGARVKEILETYDSGRIREAEVWRKIATDAVAQSPSRTFIVGGAWHGADLTLVKCKTCGFTHPIGTVTDHAYWPVEG